MKYLFTVEFPVAIGNRYRQDPAMRAELEQLFERIPHEALYVGLTRRVLFLTVDTEEPAVLADIQSTLSHVAETAPDCVPVVTGDRFVTVSRALAETPEDARS